ncbi:MAG: helix-turn-helix domain-containing protein [Burkholderiaceae bacterium]
MYLALVDVLLATSIVQSLGLAAFLLLPETFRLLSNRLLAASVLTFAAGLGEFFLYSTGLALQHPNLAYLGTLVGLLQASLLYLYTQSLMYRDFRLRPGHAIHALLFGVVSAIFVIEYYLQPTDVKLRILAGRDHPGVLDSALLAIVIHLVFLGYLWATIRSINRFGTSVRQLFSNLENRQLAWLRTLLILYAIAWTISLLYCLSAHVLKDIASARMVSSIGAIAGFLFINYLIIHALRQPAIFSGLSAQEAQEAELAEEGKGRTGPADDADTILLERLETHMAEARPYLDADLTVEQLARQLGVATRDLSRTINESLGKNFFELVNDHRIAEARRRLETAEAGTTILQLMYDSGFNSKSVFNTAFKKATGMTPSAYRARN